MTETRIVMGMPITVVVPEDAGSEAEDRARVVSAVGDVFAYLESVDRQFSPFKEESEVSAVRRGEVRRENASDEMRRVLKLCEETKSMTNGYFDAWAGGIFDPSGLVKGYSLHRAARMLSTAGFTCYAVDGAGDIEMKGLLEGGKPWSVGIRNPFSPDTIVKVVELTDCGIATSGNYIRGAHIYDPTSGERAHDIASITVIAANVFEADRLATAAFAMGRQGIEFLASLSGIEAYMVDHDSEATYTPGLERFLAS